MTKIHYAATLNNLLSDDVEEAFYECTDYFVNLFNLNNRDEILKSLYERERKMSTCIADYIAIPHAYLSTLDDTHYIGVFKNSSSIYWNSLSGKPVYLIILLLHKINEPILHNLTLQSIANSLRDNKYKNIIELTKNNTLFIEWSKNLINNITKDIKEIYYMNYKITNITSNEKITTVDLLKLKS